MKIEFRKVPSSPKELAVEFNSVKIEGTFCKISQSLVKIDSTLKGNMEIDCCRCGISDNITLDEEFNFQVSDGIYKNADSEELVFEAENGLINFEEIIQSEIESIRSDYYLCDNCSQNDSFEQEF